MIDQSENVHLSGEGVDDGGGGCGDDHQVGIVCFCLFVCFAWFFHCVVSHFDDDEVFVWFAHLFVCLLDEGVGGCGDDKQVGCRFCLFVHFLLMKITRDGRKVAARSKILGIHSSILASIIGNNRFPVIIIVILK